MRPSALCTHPAVKASTLRPIYVRIPIKPVPRKKTYFDHLKNEDPNGILSLFNDEIGPEPNFVI